MGTGKKIRLADKLYAIQDSFSSLEFQIQEDWCIRVFSSLA